MHRTLSLAWLITSILHSPAQSSVVSLSWERKGTNSFSEVVIFDSGWNEIVSVAHPYTNATLRGFSNETYVINVRTREFGQYGEGHQTLVGVTAPLAPLKESAYAFQLSWTASTFSFLQTSSNMLDWRDVSIHAKGTVTTTVTNTSPSAFFRVNHFSGSSPVSLFGEVSYVLLEWEQPLGSRSFLEKELNPQTGSFTALQTNIGAGVFRSIQKTTGERFWVRFY